MSAYYYPLVVGGYRWNILQRCTSEVGVTPNDISDLGDQTVMGFARDLTTVEKTKLDTLMADQPSFPPKGGGGFIIKDIWENFAKFKTDANLPNLQLYYSQSTGTGTVDQVYLWNPAPLTNSNKNNIKTAFNNLIVTV